MAELRQVRNIKPGFKKGLWFGLLNGAWETLVKGASPWTLKVGADWKSLDRLGEHEQPKRDYVQRELAPRDRLQGVYFAATEHDEDQPVHLHVLDRQRGQAGGVGAPVGRPQYRHPDRAATQRRRRSGLHRALGHLSRRPSLLAHRRQAAGAGLSSESDADPSGAANGAGAAARGGATITTG
ncbi:4Fe-4S dicluster domain-containing protein [Pantoea ananatis]|nr:4Fe-4S dicluster domain-containing protein [Pantoea ananatis]